MTKNNDRLPDIRRFFNVPSNFFGFEDDLLSFDEQHQSGLAISEDKEHVYVEANLPGLKPEDIEITFDHGTLWIHGAKKEQEQDKEKKYYRRASTSFSYHLQVPGLVDEKKEPEAEYKDGVMKISFSKTKDSQSKKIKFKSNSK